MIPCHLPSPFLPPSLLNRFTLDARHRSKSELSSGQPAEAAEGSARTTTSTPTGSFTSADAAASLSLLLTRFLVTAFPTLFDTMKPKREGLPAPVPTAYNTKFRHPERVPERTVCEKSVAVRTRWAIGSTWSSGTVRALSVETTPADGLTDARPKARCVPCRGAQTGWRGRRGCACEGGSRASWHDGGYSAERSACSL